MARLLLVVVIVLALILALFGVQNTQQVQVIFLGYTSGYIPLYVVILLSALVGILLSTIMGLRSRVGGVLRARRQDQRIAELERQLASRPAVLPEVPASETPASAPPQV